LDDPPGPPRIHSPDPGDDYLITLAEAARAVIISGDGHLLGLAGKLPVYSPPEFLAELDRG
jgi:predicted nucleic acid-binding protein